MHSKVVSGRGRILILTREGNGNSREGRGVGIIHSKISQALGITGSAGMEPGTAYQIRKVAKRVGRDSKVLVHQVTGSISKGEDRGSGRRDSNSKVQRRNKSIRLFAKTVEECVSSGVGGIREDLQIAVRSKEGSGMGHIHSQVVSTTVRPAWGKVGCRVVQAT